MPTYSRNPATAFVSHDELSSRIEDSNTFYIAHLEKSTISVMDGVGMLIWELLQKPLTEEDLVAEVAATFNESQETVHRGTVDFVQSLVDEDLVLRR